MLGFKSFHRSQTILAGIELIHMTRKGQYQHPQGMDCHRHNNFICWLPEKQAVQLLPPLC